ncbi:hypothetical protein V2I01_18265 [Micromonospora sp. BRA006-A]|nr:hypothetical protein [Micromonospora sp. BRA006-A]
MPRRSRPPSTRPRSATERRASTAAVAAPSAAAAPVGAKSRRSGHRAVRFARKCSEWGGPDDAAETGTVVTPSAEFPPLSDEERAALGRIGERWRGPRRADDLPVDPTLGRHDHHPVPTRFGRLTPIDMFTVAQPDELVATGAADLPGDRTGRAAARPAGRCSGHRCPARRCCTSGCANW